jgi:NAD(P)-dependent dehydrogenase (short-subunit alcohol dehydrogenase family)
MITYRTGFANRMVLRDQIIFLTGGSDGIGRECAQAYSDEGATVVIASRVAERVHAAVAELGDQHLGIECDVSKSDEVEAAIAQTLKKYGRINAIHNNAGITGPSKPLHQTSEQEWDEIFDVNLKSVYLTARYGFDALRETRGSILNTSSLVGVIGQADHAAYTATKGAMNTLTKAMALDYAKHGVRVNAVCPAGVWTPMLRRWADDQPNPRAVSEYLDAIHPLGKCPQADVVADACVFLLSEKARFITGHIMHVSGGAELGYRR